MRVVLTTTGTWGDLQPFVALGRGLRSQGHEVCIATHADYGDFVRRWGLEAFPVDDDSRVVHGGSAGGRLFAAGDNPFVFVRELARIRIARTAATLQACYRAGQGADVLLTSFTTYFLGLSAAEKLGVPCFVLALQPTTPTAFMASCLLPSLPAWLPPARSYNFLSHFLIGEYFWQLLRDAVNRARREVLGLGPFPPLGPPSEVRWQTPTLYGYSPAVLPKPPDWGEHQHVTGYWWLDTAGYWKPPADLVDFLDAGPPPVCVGFGSMRDRHAAERTACVVQALTRLKRRGILLTGWGGLEPLPSSDQFYVTEAVPHDWLFPRVAAVVHHGGAGTTAAALRAGVPAVVVPFMAEQPFWARRVAELNVGPQPIPHRELSVDRLVAGIRTALENRAMRDRVGALARRLQAEDGVGRAVGVFHRYLKGPALATGQGARQFLPSENGNGALSEKQGSKRPGQAFRPPADPRPGAGPTPLLVTATVAALPGLAVLRIPSMAAVPRTWRQNHPWGPQANAARAAGRLPYPRDLPRLTAWAEFGRRHLRDGDLLFRLGRTFGPWELFTNRFLARIQDGPFTHDGLVRREGDTVWVYDSEREGIRKIPFEVWMLDVAEGRFAVRRLRPEYRDRIPQILAYCEQKYQEEVPFDPCLSTDDAKVYCSKFMEMAFRAAGLPLSQPLPICQLPNYPRLRLFRPLAERYLGVRMDVPVYALGNEHYGAWASPYLEAVPVYLGRKVARDRHPRKPPLREPWPTAAEGHRNGTRRNAD